MANEEEDFFPFIKVLTPILDHLGNGGVYLVVDKVSRDRTLELCRELSLRDRRFVTVWAPENKNVVDAYLRGYKEAIAAGYDLVIEMDAGLSHDPRALPTFVEALTQGYECVFGSRFIAGGSIYDSKWQRTVLSRIGTVLANLLLGTRLHDMTSGFQGFQAGIVKSFLAYPLLSKAHFYQTELRYLLRNKKCIEIPINYRAPSPRVSKKAIRNALSVLLHYFFLRLQGRTATLDQ
jgi:dolichol-phosphate mannosyltransferase